jgi:glycosyltransferase involved in cell wall biosynthesis
MRKVLLLTEVFPPAFNPRMGYLVRYLSAFDWDADIITENIIQENNFKSLIGNNKIVRVNLKNTDTPHGLIQKIWRLINLKRHFINNRQPFIKGIKLNFKKDDYSVMLVSVAWANLFILDAGLKISKKWGIPLIIDLRDIQEQKPEMINTIDKSLKDLLVNYLQRSFENNRLKLRNNVLLHATAVTTVSAFHVEQISKYNNNVVLISNGFDPDLFHPGYIERTDTFLIIYTGLVFSENEQDPTLLFEAVS